jgi:hypothetical protein
MIRQRVFSLAAGLLAVGSLAACEGLKDAFTAHVDTVAKAGSQELTVERLGTMLGQSQAPLRRDVARSLAGLWVDYQLLGLAGSRGDSLADPKRIDSAMWAVIAQAKMQKLGERVLANVPQADTSNAAQRYAGNEVLGARHILLALPANAPQNVKDSVRAQAEQLRTRVTAANFADLARQRSADPGSASRGGDLGVFPRGVMVPQFEQAVVATAPGQFHPGVVESSFGYHIIYRPTFAELGPQANQLLGQRSRAVAESTYLAKLEQDAKVSVKSDAPQWIKAVAQDVETHLEDTKVIATSSAGNLTAGRAAQWIMGMPMGPQVRQQIQQAPDSLLNLFVKQLARNEVLIRQADSLKIGIDSTDIQNMRRTFIGAVSAAQNGIGVSPRLLSDSAKTAPEKERLASARVEDYLQRLIGQRAPFVDVPAPVQMALRSRFEFKINEQGVDRALERAQQIRVATDTSGRAQQQPPSAVPLPGQDAPGAAPQGGAPQGAGAQPAPGGQGQGAAPRP